MYRYRYINKHYQFGYTTYTLVLEDLENSLPTVRLDKSFNTDPQLIDDDFLYQEARKDILNTMRQIEENTLIAYKNIDDSYLQDENGDE